MVANSRPYHENVGVNTRTTGSLTPAMALEILQQALLNCQHAGVDVKAAPLYGQSAGKSVIIVLANVDLVDGKLLATEVE